MSGTMTPAERNLEPEPQGPAGLESDRELGPSRELDGEETDHIHASLCYVPSVARRYLGRGISLDELVAAGNLGLVEAALRFDPSRKVRFTTYANWWIRKSIIETLGHQSGPMRLPRYQYDKLKCLRDTRASWLSSRGTDPDKEELATAAGLSVQEVDRLFGLVTSAISLEQPLSAMDQRPLKETIEDPTSECPAQELQRQDLTRRLRRQIARLASRERQVLSLRFGLDGGVGLTLRETGRRLGISRERVRQVELRALGRLRERV